MTPDLTALIAEAKRLDSAADSGPWATKITGSGESQYCDIVQADDHCAVVCVMWNSDRELDNAEFIAHSRTAIPALVAEVERLQRVVDQAVEFARLKYMPEREG
jgi:fructose-specific phosphotransferase system component IIB